MNMWTRGLVHKCEVPVSGFVHSHSELQLPPWFPHTNQVTAPELLSIFLTFWPSWPFEYKCHHFIIVILWDIWVKYCCFMNSWVMFKSVLYQVTMTFDLWPLIFYHLIFKSKWTVCQAKKFPWGFQKIAFTRTGWTDGQPTNIMPLARAITWTKEKKMLRHLYHQEL